MADKKRLSACLQRKRATLQTRIQRATVSLRRLISARRRSGLGAGSRFAVGSVITRKFVARESPASLVRGWSASILFPGWPLPGVAAWPPLVGARHYRDWYECRGW